MYEKRHKTSDAKNFGRKETFQKWPWKGRDAIANGVWITEDAGIGGEGYNSYGPKKGRGKRST